MATRASRIALAGSNISSTGEVDADLLDNTDSAAFLSLDGSGRLGIGTASAERALHIEGSGFAASTINLVRTDTGASNDPGLQFKSAAGANDSRGMGGIWFKNSLDGNAYALIRARTDDATGTSGRLDFMTSTSAVSNSTTPSLTIKSTGNVGIGTTTPSAHAKLHVAGAPYAFLALQATNSGGRQYEIFSNAADESFHLYDRTADLYRLTVDETGNVGIGTTSPSDKLTVTGGHINLPTVNSYIKGSGHNIVQVDNTRTYFYGGTDGLQFRTADNSAALWHITNGGLLKREGGSAVDSSNTNFNINLPANGGITMGSAYTFSNIYGDAGGNLFLKANAYPANTGAATSITLQTGNASGGNDSAITVAGGNISFPNGKGINFGASTGGVRGTSSSSVLDDYEEGTYTPTYTNGSVSYSQQVGNYVKIGTFCRVWFDFTISSASGQSGTPTITLPFTSKSGDHDMGQFTPWDINNNFTSSRHATQWITTNTSYMMMYTWAGDTNTSHSGFALNTTGRISGSVCYTTA